jgi:hypothetical protein
MSDGEWYWCLRHSRVELRDGCKAADRMGPYPSVEAAEHWRETLEERNERWEAEDRDEREESE